MIRWTHAPVASTTTSWMVICGVLSSIAIIPCQRFDQSWCMMISENKSNSNRVDCTRYNKMLHMWIPARGWYWRWRKRCIRPFETTCGSGAANESGFHNLGELQWNAISDTYFDVCRRSTTTFHPEACSKMNELLVSFENWKRTGSGNFYI